MIHIYSSVVNLPEIEKFWESNKFYSTIIPNVMSKTRFQKIRKYFHVGESEKGNHTPHSNSSIKIETILNKMSNLWKEYYNYSKFVTIDECMASFKGP